MKDRLAHIEYVKKYNMPVLVFKPSHKEPMNTVLPMTKELYNDMKSVWEEYKNLEYEDIDADN